MDRGRRADALRDEVMRFGQPLLGLVEAELLILPFGFRRCLLRWDSAEDMDEVEFDRVGRQRRLGEGEGERDRVASAFVHGDADDVAHEVSFDSNRPVASVPVDYMADEGMRTKPGGIGEMTVQQSVSARGIS